MFRRIFNTLSLISAILLTCTIFLCVWSFWTDPRKESLSFSSDFHVAVHSGRVSFFNIKDYGPYHGSIISLRGDDAFAERRGFGDAYGIYYRYFRWADSGAVLWTISISLVYPLMFFAVLPTIWAWKRWRTWKRLPAREKEVGPRQQMLVAIRLYWWMGVLGAVVYLVAAFTICLRLALHLESPSLDNLGPLALCCVGAAGFGASIHVARRLAVKPEGALPYARMVGIILATAWFPILTIPGIICVRRVTTHFAAYCKSFGVGYRSTMRSAKTSNTIPQ